MAFTNKSLHSARSGMGIIKGATLFFLGMTCVMFATQALSVKTIATSAIQYISKIVLTTGGTSSTATGIYLDGVSGDGYFSGSVQMGDVTIGNQSNFGMVYNAGGSLWMLGTSGTILGPLTMYISTGGKVGIGTNTPDYTLDVAGTGKFSQGVCLGSSCRSTRPSEGDSVWSSGTNKVYYTDGNVGIGTSTPGSALTIETGGSNIALLTRTAEKSRGFSISSNGRFGIYEVDGDTDPERISITSGGNVGIGVTGSTAKLEIGGVTGNNQYLKFKPSNGTTGRSFFNNDSTLGLRATTSSNIWSLPTIAFGSDNNNVAIGRWTLPAYALAVSGAGYFSSGIQANRMYLGNDMDIYSSAGRGYMKATSGLQLYTNGDSRVTINQSGNVSVGGQIYAGEGIKLGRTGADLKCTAVGERYGGLTGVVEGTCDDTKPVGALSLRVMGNSQTARLQICKCVEENAGAIISYRGRADITMTGVNIEL